MAYSNPLKPGMLLANEIKPQRTHTSKRIRMPSLGQTTMITRAHIGHIHEFDKLDVNPRFRTVDTTINPGGGGFESRKASYHAHDPLFADDWFQVRDLYKQKDFSYSLRPDSFREEGGGPATDVSHVQGSIVTHGLWTDRAVRYPNAYGSLGHLVFVHRNHGLDHRIRILTNPGFTGNLLLTWEIDLSQIPSGQIEIRERGQPRRLWDESTTETFFGSFWLGDGLNWTQVGPFRVWDSSVGKDAGASKRVRCRLHKQGQRLLFTKIIPAAFLSDPETVYPVATDATSSFFAGGGDGWVASTIDPSWDTAHDATTGSTANDNSASAGDLFLDVRHQFGADWDIKRTFTPFDTSSIPDGDTISAADVNLYTDRKTNHENDGRDYVTQVQTRQPSNTALTTADFDLCGDTIADPTEGNDSGDRIDIGSISTSAYMSQDLNATGMGWIVKTGFTLLGQREGHDVEDEQLIGGNPRSNTVQWNQSEFTGTSTDPFFDVTHVGAALTFIPRGSFY